MAVVISLFNNKGGVGKTTNVFNIADALGAKGKRVIAVDFDPQCNLSINALGNDGFFDVLESQMTIRSFLQPRLQGTGIGSVDVRKGKDCNSLVDFVVGDFWLNLYSESLGVGSDLLTGTGIAKFTEIGAMIAEIERKYGGYDYVLIDLPPSFGSLVRAALYVSNYIIIPATSDTFSPYCIGLIGRMLPSFITDWQQGLERFQRGNPGVTQFNNFGRPKFGGWIFGGYDTRRKERDGDKHLVQADKAHKERIEEAIQSEIVNGLQKSLEAYDAVAEGLDAPYQIGGIEDMNVLIQNSQWRAAPISRISKYAPIRDLGNKLAWSQSQKELMGEISRAYQEIADNIIDHLN